MKLSFLFVLLFPVCLFAQRQKDIPGFGKIDRSELELTSCSFDPTAHAMKLFDVQESSLEVGNGIVTVKTEKRVRIKIFNEKGYKYASVKIPYLSKRRLGKIKQLSGIVYSLDASGKIVTERLEKDDFFRQKIVENVDMVYFTFPNLKPGSVIEFRYTRIERNMMQVDPWIIQDDIPTQYTSYEVTLPDFAEIREKIYGLDTVPREVVENIGKANPRHRVTYFKENIPAFKPEPFMSSYKDNMQKMIFLTVPGKKSLFSMPSSPTAIWRIAGRSLMESPLFGGQIKKEIPGTEKIIDSALKIASIENRIGFLYDTVRKGITEKAEQTLYPGDIIEAWKNKSGNTAETNLILLNLLSKAKVTAYPLLVSTREHGKVNKTFPTISQLNGVDVLALDSAKFYLMDASLKHQSFQTPPLNILNREAFLLHEDSMQWVTVTDNRALMKQSMNVFAEIKDNGRMEGTASTQYFDYAKFSRLDSALEEENKKDKEKAESKQTVGLKIISVKSDNQEPMEEPLFETMEFTYEPHQTDNFFFINPRFLYLEKNNPFISDKRETDIDFGCNHEMITSMQIFFPASFEIDHLPKNISLLAEDSSFSYRRSFSKQPDYIQMTETFEVKRSIFSKEEYTAIYDFFKRMHSLMPEEIVFKKKK